MRAPSERPADAKSQAEVEALRKRESEHEAVCAELVETKQRLGDALLARNTWIEEERKTAAKERADSVLHGRSAAPPGRRRRPKSRQPLQLRLTNAEARASEPGTACRIPNNPHTTCRSS